MTKQHTYTALFVFCGLAMTTACHSSSRPLIHYHEEKALGPYSAAVKAGSFVFLSGKIGDPNLDFAEQVHSAIGAIDNQLASIGLDWKHVVSVTVYLVEIKDYPVLNSVYSKLIPAPFPTRAVVDVDALPAGAKIEMQVLAVCD